MRLSNGHPSWRHLLGRDLRPSYGPLVLAFPRVDLGPATFAASWGEPLQPRRVIITLLLGVDPSKAECLIERFKMGDGGFSRILLKNTQPNAISLAMVCRKLLTILRRRSKAKNFIHTSQKPAPAFLVFHHSSKYLLRRLGQRQRDWPNTYRHPVGVRT